MDALFRRLQEVTELPSSLGSAADAPDATTDHSRLPPLEDDDDLDADELAEQLREARRDAAEYQTKWESLRTESSKLNEEYAAYKTKVQTWREQVRVARAQDRKTIELLRNSNASSGGATSSADHDGNVEGPTTTVAGPSSTSANGSSTEAIYVSSLEEQVRTLKDAVRQGNDERNAIRLEFKRAQDHHQEELRKLSEVSSSVGTVMTQASSNPNEQQGGAVATTAHATMVLQMRIDAKDVEVHQLRQNVEELERQNEALAEEARSFADAVQRLESAHTAQLSQTQGLLDEHRQVQYIRSLESEIRMWKAEAQAARVGLTPIATSSSSLKDETHSSSSPSAANAVEEEMMSLRLVLQDKEELLKDIRAQMADLSVEASLREESIERMFNDCREIEEQLMSKQAEIAAVCRDRDAWQHRSEEAERVAREMKSEAEDLADKLVVTQGQLSKLSKDHTQVGDVLRSLRLQLAAAATAAAASSPSHSGAGNKSDAGGRASVAAGDDIGGNDSSTASFAASLVSEVANVLSSRAHQLRNVSAAQEQVHRFWTDMMARRRTLWTNTRWKVNLLVVLFLFLVLLFSFYQGLSAIDESSVEEALKKCEGELKALRK